MVSRYVPDTGDLIWVDFDPTKGSEQAGHRPAVVLSPFMYNNKTGMCLCVTLYNAIKRISVRSCFIRSGT